MLARTFQNDTQLSKFAEGIKNSLNVFGVGKKSSRYGYREFGLGDLVIPYSKMAGNQMSSVIEYSPAGIIKAIYNIGSLTKEAHTNAKERKALNNIASLGIGKGVDAEADALFVISNSSQRKAILSLSRPLTGGALIWAGYALAQAGIIAGNPSYGKEEDLEQAKRNSQFTINILAVL